MTEEQNREQLENISERTEKKSKGLSINRVPVDTLESFKETAHERWAGDYGMYLAYLVEIDRLRDQYDNKFSATAEKVGELQQEVAELRSIIKNDEDEDQINTIG